MSPEAVIDGVDRRPGWLKRVDAPAYSGISLSAIDVAISQGKVKSRKAGASRLINRESLDEWIESEEWLDKKEDQ